MDIEDNDYSSDDSEVTTADQDLIGKTEIYIIFISITCLQLQLDVTPTFQCFFLQCIPQLLLKSDRAYKSIMRGVDADRR